ncbi:hypothetical protein BB558_000292 [Smittium angustum]|uniref:Actin-related protein 5 n=1 Tax=Smittium angustum TaxID=133377 RepID=A0A2U1JEQ0_SMIAN|nr:hypothetical protein BB558_000292 [Smittium angustum]
MTKTNIFKAPTVPNNVEFQKIFNDYNKFKNNSSIVIDYGSDTCRAGWSVEESPRLIFENSVSKFKNKKGKPKNVILVGNDIYTDPSAYSTTRSAFDNGLIYNFDVVENTLDYIFTVLGIDTDSINHPIVMTEPTSNLFRTRKNMNELLFEGYNVPSVAYGIDSLWSYYYNNTLNTDGINDRTEMEDGIIISTGNFSTHIIPIFNGKPQLKHCQRINIGGNSMVEYLLKLIQVKYPVFPTKILQSQTKKLAQDHLYFSQDYQKEISTLFDKEVLENVDHIIQFPFHFSENPEKSQEELDKQAERRRENAKKLQQIAARVRLEKLEKREEDLIEYQELLGYAETDDIPTFNNRLRDYGFRTKQELEAEIKKVENTLKRARDKDLGIDPADQKEANVSTNVPKFDLVEVPDEQLGPEELKEKRKQKLIKANYDARDRAKRRILLDSIEQKAALKNELSNRKSKASQLRMKSIAGLAAHETQPVATSGSRRKRQDDSDDNFGEDDNDWNIYLDISKEVSDSDDSPEIELLQINELLYKNDAKFLEEIDEETRKEIEGKLLYRFYSGTQEAILETPAVPFHLSTSDGNGDQVGENGTKQNLMKELMSRSYQVHLNIERIRVPEILFDPMIVGDDQCGIIELVENMWKLFPEKKTDFAKNIFVTGQGFASVKGFSSRLYNDLVPILPIGTEMNIKMASDLALDAWKGAALWTKDVSENSNQKNVFMTREEYNEYGGEYFKEHEYSNLYKKII